MEEHRSSVLGKRPVEEVQEAAQESSQGSQPGRKRRFARQKDWPSQWKKEYSAWKRRKKSGSDGGFGALGTGRFKSKSSPPPRPRCERKCGGGRRSRTHVQAQPPQPTQEEGRPPRGATQESLVASNPEEASHDWQEGARIGEAKNPGANQGGSTGSLNPRNRSGTRAPGVNHQHKKTHGRHRGAGAASQAPAMELAKGFAPAPSPRATA